MLSAGLFVWLQLSDLSSVDDPYWSLLSINSVRGVHTATEWAGISNLFVDNTHCTNNFVSFA